jgi:branched-chain amino acid transport system permease protein
MPDLGAIDILARRHSYHPLEAMPWLAALAAYFAFPSYLPLGAQILATILFALSADLVLGYAGIVTLGQAARFSAPAPTPPGFLPPKAGASPSPDYSLRRRRRR